MYLQLLSIDNDNQAEEIVQAIKEAEDEKNRLIDICKAQIDKYNQKIEQYKMELENETKDATTMLGEYCRNKANHSTKTLVSYKLPSGKLQWKMQNPKIVKDEKKLLEWIDKNASDFVKFERKPNWELLKRALTESGNHYEYVNPDGEIIPVDGVTLEEQPDVFTIN
jgi:ABC-type Zn uptake system ZnuABC Zn-binding protein ZnuA